MELNLETAEAPFQGFKDYEVQRMRRDIAWMKEGQKLDRYYIEKQRADFYRFFNEHDKRRGTEFERTFPEMTEFWKECRYHAQN
jgi:beta-xylosidase